MKIAVEIITPKKASEILEKNYKGNRRIRKHSVDVYAEMMRSGNWQLTHQGIAISSDGNLIDGQHRLSAVIKAGIPVKMTVARDVPEEQFHIFDRGIKRSDADILNIDPAVAQACRNLAIMMVGGTDSQNIALVEKINKSEIGDIFRMIVEKCPKKARLWSSSTTKIAVMYVIYNGLATPEYALDLYENLVKHRTEEFPPVAHVMFRKYMNAKLPSLSRNSHFIADMVFMFTETNADRKHFQERESFARNIWRDIVSIGRSVI